MATSRKASQSSAKKRASSKRRRKNTPKPWWQRVLLSTLLWKLVLVVLVLLLAYLVYLDAKIRHSFEGKKWALPARVYAQPMELYVGARLSAAALVAELRRLGYREGVPDASGMFRQTRQGIELYSRGHTFWDGDEKALRLRLRFDNGMISDIKAPSAVSPSIVRLDPLPIGAIYPQHNEDRMLVQLADVPPLLIAGLLAVEDRRFYQHHGVSPSSILRAAWRNMRQGEVVQGGSTITQQLVKNFYLTRERSYRRKFNEALMALLLEWRYSKDEILEAYLNEVYLGQAGSRGIHGFALASYHYFNRPLHELSADKLALLIGLVKGPAYYDPWRHEQRALSRRNAVLDIMLRQDLLHEQDAMWAQAQSIALGKRSRSQFAYPAFIDLVRKQLRSNYSDEALSADGLNIYTSLSPRLQGLAEQAIQKGLSRLKDADMQAAMIVVDVATGEVQAVVGGKEPRFAGFNRALTAQRPIGSLMKPVVYLNALQRSSEYHLASIISDEPLSVETETGEWWSPKNFDRENHGDVPLFMAFAHSYNQASVRLGMMLGLDSIADTMLALGVTPPETLLPSMIIGSTDMSPFSVAELYQPIASGGLRTPLRSIRSVLDSTARPLEHFPLSAEQVVNDRAMYLLQYAMALTMRHGTGRAASRWLPSSLAVAGKTGTSNDHRDAWFAGFSGDLLAIVWVGRDDNQAGSITGSSAALPIWAEFMASASAQSLRLSVPEGIVFAWVDSETGQRSQSNCESAVKLPFIKGTTGDAALPAAIMKGSRHCSASISR